MTLENYKKAEILVKRLDKVNRIIEKSELSSNNEVKNQGFEINFFGGSVDVPSDYNVLKAISEIIKSRALKEKDDLEKELENL